MLTGSLIPSGILNAGLFEKPCVFFAFAIVTVLERIYVSLFRIKSCEPS
jgi:hypothetical protein